MSILSNATKTLAIAIAAVCAGFAALPALASADPVEVSVFPYDDQDPNGHGPIGVIEMRAQAGDSSGHAMIAGAYGDGSYSLFDDAGVEIAPEGPGEVQASRCSQLSEMVVVCSLPEGYSEGKLQVRASRARDFISMENLDGTLWTDVLGQGGADRILGSDGDDYIYGGGGRDVLIGHAGHDTLSGEQGVDVIRSRDGMRDEISCGPGDNRAEKAVHDRRDRRITIVAGGAWVVERVPISC
jgi:Ca2+-binding RTX toxin-like protein